jgi:AcrR family transcriptional regulator
MESIMPRDKTDTHKKIVTSAKREFLEQGFEKASMRKIAAQAGITAGGVYKHFPTKEAMFEALVEPTLKECYRRDVELTNIAIKQIANQKFDLFRTASDSGNREVLDYIYHHFDEFQLMFNRSAGTKYETIRHDLVMLEVSGAKRLIEALRKQEIPIREFNDEQLHILYSTALTPLFEIVTHGYPYEKALTFIDLMADAMNFGWEKIMNP